MVTTTVWASYEASKCDMWYTAPVYPPLSPPTVSLDASLSSLTSSSCSWTAYRPTIYTDRVEQETVQHPVKFLHIYNSVQMTSLSVCQMCTRTKKQKLWLTVWTLKTKLENVSKFHLILSALWSLFKHIAPSKLPKIQHKEEKRGAFRAHIGKRSATTWQVKRFNTLKKALKERWRSVPDKRKLKKTGVSEWGFSLLHSSYLQYSLPNISAILLGFGWKIAVIHTWTLQRKMLGNVACVNRTSVTEICLYRLLAFSFNCCPCVFCSGKYLMTFTYSG